MGRGDLFVPCALVLGCTFALGCQGGDPRLFSACWCFETLVIKILVFKYILAFLLGRPPTFLAGEGLGSAEFC